MWRGKRFVGWCDMSEWIKCSDRLPPNHTKVLCCNRLMIAIATRVNNSWFASISSYPMNPTHWQPLPEPPKDE